MKARGFFYLHPRDKACLERRRDFLNSRIAQIRLRHGPDPHHDLHEVSVLTKVLEVCVGKAELPDDLALMKGSGEGKKEAPKMTTVVRVLDHEGNEITKGVTTGATHEVEG